MGWVKSPVRKRRRARDNPLITWPTTFHSFVRWLIPALGVSESEKAIVNICGAIEKIGNATSDAVRALQKATTELSKVTLQTGWP